ncbi:MAG: ABC transporter permease, partial [Bacilli bacterium]
LIISLLFIGMGMLFGSLLKEQQVGPIVSIVVQVVAFLSGMWFSLDLVGGAFEVIGRILPFSHAVDLLKYILANDFTNMLISLLILIGYILVINILAIITFKKKMKS